MDGQFHWVSFTRKPRAHSTTDSQNKLSWKGPSHQMLLLTPFLVFSCRPSLQLTWHQGPAHCQKSLSCPTRHEVQISERPALHGLGSLPSPPSPPLTHNVGIGVWLHSCTILHVQLVASSPKRQQGENDSPAPVQPCATGHCPSVAALGLWKPLVLFQHRLIHSYRLSRTTKIHISVSSALSSHYTAPF